MHIYIRIQWLNINFVRIFSVTSSWLVIVATYLKLNKMVRKSSYKVKIVYIWNTKKDENVGLKEGEAWEKGTDKRN